MARNKVNGNPSHGNIFGEEPENDNQGAATLDTTNNAHATGGEGALDTDPWDVDDEPTPPDEKPDPKLPPEDDDDFFSPENMRLAAQMAPEVKPVNNAFEVKKPPKDKSIRIHPDPNFSKVWPAFEVDEVFYLIHPKLARTLEADPVFSSSVHAVRLMLCAIADGPFFVWCVKQPLDPAKAGSMHEAREQAIAHAMKGWVRITWSAKKGIHECFPYVGPDRVEPDWPDMTFQEIMKVVFGESRMIKDLNHPIVRKLGGLEL